jgi:hypothetical protein
MILGFAGIGFMVYRRNKALFRRDLAYDDYRFYDRLGRANP